LKQNSKSGASSEFSNWGKQMKIKENAEIVEVTLDALGLTLDNLPFCCGIWVVGEFPTGLVKGWSNYLEAEIVKPPTLKERSCFIESNIPRYAVTLASLSEYQFSEWEAALKQAGFARIIEARNPNSCNKIRLYMRKPDQTRRPRHL
jgi:hypothetical protein